MDKGRNAKVRRNKKKKKKKGLLIFFSIILLCILAVGGIYAYKVNKLGGGLQGFLAAAIGHDEETKEKLEEIKFLALGKSQNLTDTIMVCSYNPKEQSVSMLSIPRDTFVGTNKNKATAFEKINALYQTSPQKTLDAVNKITGLDIKYYATIDTKSLRRVVDAVGGIYYDVPMDMVYDDDTQKLHINLKKGYQLLDGDKAEQLLRFRHGNNVAQTYPEEWGEQDLGRMRTQREFLKVAANQILQLKNMLKLGEILDIVHDNLQTNIPLDLVKDYIPYAVNFNTENIKSDMLPGTPEKCNGVWIYTYDKSEAQKIIAELFLNGEEQAMKPYQLNIELINNSGKTKNLTEVTNILKEKGYNVIKSNSGKTIKNTSIINRTDQIEETVNNLKEIINTEDITEGKENSVGADFTINIGKDILDILKNK